MHNAKEEREADIFCPTFQHILLSASSIHMLHKEYTALYQQLHIGHNWQKAEKSQPQALNLSFPIL